jgi:phenylalanyl-tRNA synthetase beta chain
MFLSLKWLRDFVDIPKSITPEELGVRLTMHTVEIDGVVKESDKFKGVVVGKLLEVKVHPNADRLRLARVDIGGEELGIVCGAPNIEAGQKVPVALVGAILPNGMEIKEASIRGENSRGMLCAEDELGLGEDHGGIMILDEKTKPGTAFAEYLGLDDVVFEVDNKSITNRPDLWGHYGMAREISAFLDTKRPKLYENKTSQDIKEESEAGNISIKIEDLDLCPRYMAVAMDGVIVAESPKWLKDRLVAVGVRPINNIVDVTNYVMMEVGQPMHAFDRSLIDKIIVRHAKNGEVITTLDGEKRELANSDLVIADSSKAVAIAGVMGGENSEISDKTSSILLESANFNFLSIRKTAGKFNLRTEASMRYEKSMDPNLCETALVRAVELLKEIIPDAKVASKVIDEKKSGLKQEPIQLGLAWLHMILGEEIKKAEIIKILERLGFGVKEDDYELEITVPSWRATKDISIKEDIAEEVARIYGYDKLSPSMPRIEIKSPLTNPARDFEKKLRNILKSAANLVEVFNYSFVGEDQLKKMGLDFSDYLRLANPISQNQALLRQNLAVHLLGNVKTNQARISRRGLFEIGNIFLPYPGETQKNDNAGDKLPFQEKRIAICYVNDGADDILMAMKSEIIGLFFSHLNLSPVYSLNTDAPNWSLSNKATNVSINAKVVGSIDVLEKTAAQKLGIKKPAAIAEFSLAQLLDVYESHNKKVFKEFDKFPPLTRDIALVVNNKILYNDIKNEIANFHPLIKSVDLFDVYQGEKIGKDNKNLAFHVVYQADRTLISEEVDVIQNNLVKKLEDKFEAKMRDY